MAAVARQSSPRLALVTSDLPSARLEIMSARWVMDLSPGTSRVPRRGAEAGEVRHRRLIDMDRCLLVYSSFINSSSLDICFASLHPVTQAHERPDQGFCPLGTGYDELQTPLATLGGVDDTKVFDVGSELAGGRRDLGEHSRAVGHHQGKAYGLTPVVGLGEDVYKRQARAVEPRSQLVPVLRRDHRGHRLEATSQTSETLKYCLTVRSDNGDPQVWVAGGYARHIAEPAAGETEQGLPVAGRYRDVHESTGGQLGKV